MSGLTSRTVTAEAGVAKGVMHRHFADFDAFLAELILDRAVKLGDTANALAESAGTGTVVDNLTDALTVVFSPLAVAVPALIITRDGVRERLRHSGGAHFPLIADGTAMVAAYLVEEQAQCRVLASTDIPTLSYMLIGSVHLFFTDREEGPPDAKALHDLVAAVIEGLKPG